MISWTEAASIIRENVAALDREVVPLDQLLGRTLTRPIVATHCQPDLPRSMMDGIAVRGPYPAVGSRFRLLASSDAGGALPRRLGDGEATPIATGAVVPDGATLIIPKENFRGDGDEAIIEIKGSGNRYIRDAGADFDIGDPLLPSGVRIGPRSLGLIAAANLVEAEVARAPRIAILTNGDELAQPGSALRPGQTIDSASFVIAAIAEKAGADATRLPRLPDDGDQIAAALRQAAGDFDALVVLGGASVGARDHSRDAARQAGFAVAFERVNVQPGKPSWFGTHTSGTPILGLPGNPVSAFVCAELFLKPMIAALSGHSTAQVQLMARLVDRPIAAQGRAVFIRCVVNCHDAEWTARPLPDQDSGLQRALAEANALIPLDPFERRDVGETVTVQLLDNPSD